MKEKLKRLKLELKQWNVDVFGDLNALRKKLTMRINELENKAEEEGLDEEEGLQRREAQAEFWRVAKMNESLLCQKSRMRWIKEGDMNSKFFHSMINWRRRSDSVVGLLMDGS